VLLVLSFGATARAQGLPPLPPPPPPPPPQTAPAQPTTQSQGTPAPPQRTAVEVEPAPPPPPIPPPPPRVVYVELQPPVRAPKYSLWLGGRAGLLTYSGGLYINNQATGGIETTGNFVRPALGLELDVGARLAWRYVPYLALELGVTGPGHRFDNATAPTTAGTQFFGAGFRYLAGDVNKVAFAADLSLGIRRFVVTSGGSTWSASGLEIFRLGLGAEIRVNSRFAVSPMLTLSGGSPQNVSGNVSFAPNQGDGQKGPPFTGDTSIPGWAQTSYYAIFLGCGGHVDVFGR
jgi:hypothetical protein